MHMHSFGENISYRISRRKSSRVQPVFILWTFTGCQFPPLSTYTFQANTQDRKSTSFPGRRGRRSQPTHGAKSHTRRKKKLKPRMQASRRIQAPRRGTPLVPANRLQTWRPPSGAALGGASRDAAHRGSPRNIPAPARPGIDSVGRVKYAPDITYMQ